MSNLATISNNILADSGIDDINVVVTTGSYANPAWITSLAWTKITGAPANIVTGTGTLNYHAKWVSGSALGNSLIFDDGTNVGINTTSLSKNINLAGTTRHERIYAYPNYVFDFTNSVGETFTWFRLGNATPFSQTRIFYRAGTSTSEEEGEIKISNTCDRPFIEWTRNTYNYHVREVRGRMTGGCGQCEVWVLVRHGNYNAGPNTNFQWQINGGTDSAFAVVNAIGTPGTGTNTASINSTDGYFYNNSGNISIAGRMSIGTTSPVATANLFIEGTSIVLNTENSNQAKSIYFRFSDGGDLRSDSFLTFSTGGTPSEKARLTAAGRFGIGTTVPLANLHVLGESSGSRGIIAEFRNSDNSARIDIRDENGATSQPPGLYSPVAGFGLGLYSNSGPIIFYSGGISPFEERMRILTTGQVGIGTTSPSAKLHVVGDGIFSSSTNTALTVSSSGGVALINLTTGAGTQAIYGGVGGSNVMDFYTASAFRMRLDASGNLGLGVTPSAWTINPAFQIKDGGSLWALNNQNLWLSQNVYFDGSYRYIASVPASQYVQSSGGHIWYQAPSGTAGNAISFTQAMTLDASGRLGIGVTNMSSYNAGGNQFVIGGGEFRGLTIAATTEGNIYFADGTTGADSYRGTIGYNHTSNYLYFFSDGSERMRITSGGNVLIGTTSAEGKLTINNSSLPAIKVNQTASGHAAAWLDTNEFGLAITSASTSTAHYLTNMSSGGASRFYVRTDGNVGIGTTSPSARLDVLGGIQAAIIRTSDASTFYTTYQVNTTTVVGYIGNGNGIVSGGGVNTFGVRSESDLIFAAGGNAERMRITSSGNVSIGNTNNTYKLDVSGTGIFRGDALYVYDTGSIEIGRDTTFSTPYMTVGFGGRSNGFNRIYGARDTTDGLFLSAATGRGIILVTNGNTVNALILASSGAATLSNLAGTGSRIVVADASGTLSASSALSGYISGSGTTNYLPKFTGASTIGNSDLITDGSGNLAIAQGNNPTQALNLYRAGSTQTVMAVGNSNTGLNGTYFGVDANGNGIINTTGAFANIFSTNGSERMRIVSGGSVGIGTSSPQYLLHVVGTGTAINLAVVGNIRAGGSGTTGGEIIASGALGNGNYVALRHDDNNGYITVTRTVFDGHLILQPFGNVGIGTTTPNAKLTLYGGTSDSYILNFSRVFGQVGSLYTDGGGVGITQGTLDQAGIYLVQNSKIDFRVNGSERMRIDSNGFVGINNSSPNRNLTVSGTTRHERIYGYGDNALSITNSVSFGTVWVHLGTCNPFTTDKIYYRVATNTSEEEGEVTISNTCAFPFVQWQRNTYNAMVVQVRARMTGGCGQAQVWMQIRYGSDFGGAATNFRWQAYNGTDSGFAIVNAIGTPGTGTNEKSIVGSEGYFYANSGSIFAADRIGIGTTAPLGNLDVSTSGNTQINITAGSTALSRLIFGTTSGNNRGFIDYDNTSSVRAMIFRTNEAEAMRITSSGNLGLGNTDPGARLVVTGTGAANTRSTIATFNNSNNSLRVYISDENGATSQPPGVNSDAGFGLGLYAGNGPIIMYTGGVATTNARLTIASGGAATFTSSVTATSFFESSDERLKSNIIDLDVNVSSIIAKSYLKDGMQEIGYIAQDVENILPSAVSIRENGYLDLSYRQIHTAKIAALEKEVAELKKQLNNK